jgi:hypothetical protein
MEYGWLSGDRPGYFWGLSSDRHCQSTDREWEQRSLRNATSVFGVAGLRERRRKCGFDSLLEHYTAIPDRQSRNQALWCAADPRGSPEGGYGVGRPEDQVPVRGATPGS